MDQDGVLTENDSSPDSSSKTYQTSSFFHRPNPELIDHYVLRISESQALNRELLRCQIDPKTIAYLIATFRLREECFGTAHEVRAKSLIRAKDGMKKIKKRHPDGAKDKKRDKLRKSIILQETHRIVAKESQAGRYKTKHKPPLGDLFVLLKAYISDKTKDPFKIMAALSLLFNLRPEKQECHEREGADGQLATCKHYDKETNTCTRKTPFRAPCFANERQALWQMTRRAEVRFPKDLPQRFFLPENQI